MCVSKKFKNKFSENDIEWKTQMCGISNGKPWVQAVPYIQARAIQERLDEVVGWDNWEDSYRKEGTSWICKLSVTIDGRKISKENGACQTNFEPTKGGISDSFKRVASSGFGIGRYLYNETLQYAECSTEKKQGYTERTKTKDGKFIYWKKPKLSTYTITREQVKRLCTLQNKACINDDDMKAFLIKHFDIDSKKELTTIQYEKVIKSIEKEIKNQQQKETA